MVSLDRIVTDVNQYTGNPSGRRLDYERATQGLPVVNQAVQAIEALLKAETGYGAVSFPQGKSTKTYAIGDVKFTIVSQTATKRPAYKEAVESLERHIGSISFLASQGREIKGALMRKEGVYLGVEPLAEDAQVIVGGIMIPTVKHTISYTANPSLESRMPKTIEIPEKIIRLTPNTAALYVQLDSLKDHYEKFIKAYNQDLAQGQQAGTQQTTRLTKTIAATTTKSAPTGPDWAKVIKTMVSGDNEDEDGELIVLADPDISLKEKQEEFPWYDLRQLRTGEDKGLHVSAASVYNRIQELKCEDPLVAERITIERKTIV